MGIAVLSTVAAFTVPSLFFFPACIIYIAVGLIRTVLAGFNERLPQRDPLIDVDETEQGHRDLEYDSIEPRPRFRRRVRRFPK